MKRIKIKNRRNYLNLKVKDSLKTIFFINLLIVICNVVV